MTEPKNSQVATEKLGVNKNTIPELLKDRDQWIVWKALKKDNGNKVSKVSLIQFQEEILMLLTKPYGFYTAFHKYEMGLAVALALFLPVSL